MSARRLPVDGTFIEHETPADGNVFADLGIPPAEAENLLMRTRLMFEVERIITERGLKQRQAAQLFGVSQPRISELVRGKMQEFTIDSLVNMLAHAGVRVNVSLSPILPAAGEAIVPAHAASS